VQYKGVAVIEGGGGQIQVHPKTKGQQNFLNVTNHIKQDKHLQVEMFKCLQ
jgi:hypothetical protein